MLFIRANTVEAELRRRQRKLARAKRGSKNRQKRLLQARRQQEHGPQPPLEQEHSG